MTIRRILTVESDLATLKQVSAPVAAVDDDLRRLMDGMPGAALIYVIIANDIRNKDPIEYTALQYLRDIGPVFQILILPGPVTRMRP